MIGNYESLIGIWLVGFFHIVLLNLRVVLEGCICIKISDFLSAHFLLGKYAQCGQVDKLFEVEVYDGLLVSVEGLKGEGKLSNILQAIRTKMKLLDFGIVQFQAIEFVLAQV